MDVMSLRRGLMMGMASNIVKSELITTYTVPEDWTDTPNGNPLAVKTAILTATGVSRATIGEKQAILMVFENNQAQLTYRANMMYMCGGVADDNTQSIYGWRNNYGTFAPSSANYNFFVSQGTTVKIYKITYDI